jgi:hypothetical protein
MSSMKITEYAQQLVSAHGPAAAAEAARKAQEAENAGKTEEAEQWRRVREAIARMKSPHES